MNSETIMQSHILDIIFEKRNKLYGAYTLRKFYNNRLIKSLGITLGAAIILCAFTFIDAKGKIFFPVTEVSLTKIKETKTAEVKKELPKHSIKSSQLSQKKYLVPVIVNITMKPDTVQNILPDDIPGSTNRTIKGNEGLIIIGEPASGKSVGEVQKPSLPVIDVTQPIDNPEIEPAYPGGINALTKFLQKNLNNPADMAEGEIVSVNVRFVVGYDGKLQKFTVVKDGGAIFNNEVIRVLKRMPEWIPGKSKGQNVAVYFTIPVKFVPAD